MITVDALTKRFGAVTAVHDLSFEVAAGAVTGFIGPNGAGKSTTMRMILGLDRPTSGRALVNGMEYAAAQAPRRTWWGRCSTRTPCTRVGRRERTFGGPRRPRVFRRAYR